MEGFSFHPALTSITEDRKTKMIEADRVHSTPPLSTSPPIAARPIVVDAVLIAIIVVCAAAAGYLVGGLQ